MTDPRPLVRAADAKAASRAVLHDAARVARNLVDIATEVDAGRLNDARRAREAATAVIGPNRDEEAALRIQAAILTASAAFEQIVDAHERLTIALATMLSAGTFERQVFDQTPVARDLRRLARTVDDAGTSWTVALAEARYAAETLS